MDWLLSTVQQYVSTDTLIWLTVLSMVFFLGTLIAIPFILVRLPADYFDVRVPRPWMKDHHPVLRLVGHIVKNAVGAIFLFAGFLMLFLPGQGVLTMLIGISMLDFPGKRTVEAKLIGQPTVLSVVNSMRQKFNKPPLLLAPDQ
ncbi:MAG TPA: PGPGW domain-containing protein [Nitrospira sp.]|jgi:Putative transmembrane protein (PGPGW)|nr:PGPGW domain-containing protein [Nitrospira sp.]HZH48796.1 PGPGW domain-containing protein [Nitrospira sp.]